MVTPKDTQVRDLAAVAAANLVAILGRRGMSGADLAKITSARGGATKKTVYNALNKAQPPKLQKLIEYANALEIPAWALLLPGLDQHPELLDPGALKPLVKVVENYLRTDPTKRAKIERMAQAMRDEADLDR